MRLIVTRPQADGERTAGALRARGHQALIAPLMRVEPIAADFAGTWSAVVITSANAPVAISSDPGRAAICKLPLYAVGRRSAEAARQAGFADVTSAGGDVHDLVRLLVARRTGTAPLLYLAGEDRAVDLISELAARGLTAEMRIIYRAVTAHYPPQLVAAIKAGTVDGVLHFSRRSAENYLVGARHAGLADEALTLRHYCLSAAIAELLIRAGAAHVAVARRPEEATLIELVEPPTR